MTSIAKLIDDYSQGASLLRGVLRPVADDLLDLRPASGRWSVREVVCHLADAEIMYADRMKRVIAEDEPVFFNADPQLFVPALYCRQRSLDNELNLIEAVRAHVLPILRALEPGQFQRLGRHSTDGPLSLQTLLQRITAHIPHHITFIEDKLSGRDQLS